MGGTGLLGLTPDIILSTSRYNVWLDRFAEFFEATQGMFIFCIWVVCNAKVRKAFWKKITCNCTKIQLQRMRNSQRQVNRDVNTGTEEVELETLKALNEEADSA
jgi:hypothetical protein